MPEKPELGLETVAWWTTQSGGITRLPAVAAYEKSMGRPPDELVLRTAAQALLAERDERIKELEREYAEPEAHVRTRGDGAESLTYRAIGPIRGTMEAAEDDLVSFDCTAIARESRITELEARLARHAGMGWPAAMDQPIGEDNVDGVGRSLAEWQDAIRSHVVERSGAPDGSIDGSGSDSGDPLDLTLTEIDQGFNFMDEQLDRWRPIVRAVAEYHKWRAAGAGSRDPASLRLYYAIEQEFRTLSEEERAEILKGGE